MNLKMVSRAISGAHDRMKVTKVTYAIRVFDVLRRRSPRDALACA
jgi:hypothetical protein